jgi:hypothetical protein
MLHYNDMKDDGDTDLTESNFGAFQNYFTCTLQRSEQNEDGCLLGCSAA